MSRLTDKEFWNQPDLHGVAGKNVDPMAQAIITRFDVELRPKIVENQWKDLAPIFLDLWDGKKVVLNGKKYRLANKKVMIHLQAKSSGACFGYNLLLVNPYGSAFDFLAVLGDEGQSFEFSPKEVSTSFYKTVFNQNEAGVADDLPAIKQDGMPRLIMRRHQPNPQEMKTSEVSRAFQLYKVMMNPGVHFGRKTVHVTSHLVESGAEGAEDEEELDIMTGAPGAAPQQLSVVVLPDSEVALPGESTLVTAMVLPNSLAPAEVGSDGVESETEKDKSGSDSDSDDDDEPPTTKTTTKTTGRRSRTSMPPSAPAVMGQLAPLAADEGVARDGPDQGRGRPREPSPRDEDAPGDAGVASPQELQPELEGDRAEMAKIMEGHVSHLSLFKKDVTRTVIGIKIEAARSRRINATFPNGTPNGTKVEGKGHIMEAFAAHVRGLTDFECKGHVEKGLHTVVGELEAEDPLMELLLQTPGSNVQQEDRYAPVLPIATADPGKTTKEATQAELQGTIIQCQKELKDRAAQEELARIFEPREKELEAGRASLAAREKEHEAKRARDERAAAEERAVRQRTQASTTLDEMQAIILQSIQTLKDKEAVGQS